jgi:hypothetical protein
MYKGNTGKINEFIAHKTEDGRVQTMTALGKYC